MPGAEVEHTDFTPLNGQQSFARSDWSPSWDAGPASSMHTVGTYGRGSNDIFTFMYIAVSLDAIFTTLVDTKFSPKTKDISSE